MNQDLQNIQNVEQQQNSSNGSSIKKFLWIGCGTFLVIGILLFGGCCIWVMTLPEGGVRLKNEMEPYATEYLEKNKVLPEGSELVAYYDVTVNGTSEEAAILTKDSVIYHKNGKNEIIKLKDVKDIKTRQEPMVGDIIEIYGNDGSIMKIEIASFNNGETFINILKNSWDEKKAKK